MFVRRYVRDDIGILINKSSHLLFYQKDVPITEYPPKNTIIIQKYNQFNIFYQSDANSKL